MPTPEELRKAINSADADIRAAMWANDMDLAQTLVSRKVGWRLLAGDISAKLRTQRL